MRTACCLLLDCRCTPISGRRASHVLVKTEAEALKIKNEIASGTCDFAEAASKYSTCPSSARGGKLGKFAPGVMAKEFDDVVFSLVDTGRLNPVRTHVATAAGASLFHDVHHSVALGRISRGFLPRKTRPCSTSPSMRWARCMGLYRPSLVGT